MELLRIIGGICVFMGATGIGYCQTRQYYLRLSQLRNLRRGMELVCCQMNYTLYSIPKLLSLVGEQIKPPVGSYFINLGNAITHGIPRHRAHEDALNRTKGLNIPNEALMALIEWSSTLGQFDPEGENRMMQLSIHRMEQALYSYEEEKKSMVKSYTLLGACTGIALVILLL